MREKVRDFFENTYIKWRMIDRKIANDAQKLCWDHAVHPRDAIHLATAMEQKCDFLETSDRGLLRLDGKKSARDGVEDMQTGCSKPKRPLRSTH